MSMLLFCECKLIKTLKLFQNFKWLEKAIQDNSFTVYCKLYGTHVQTPKVCQLISLKGGLFIERCCLHPQNEK